MDRKAGKKVIAANITITLKGIRKELNHVKTKSTLLLQAKQQ